MPETTRVDGWQRGQAHRTSRQDSGGSGRNRNNRKPRNSNNSSDSSDNSNIIDIGDSRSSSNSSNNSNSRNSGNSINSSNIPQTAYDLVRAKRIRCLEPGHRWRECIAYVPPVEDTNGHNKASENVCCLASVLLGTSVGSSKENPSKNTAESTYHMTRSADMMHDIRPTNDRVTIGGSRTVDIVGYGTLTAVFS